jgi:RNA polymerase sigma-70 factor, ECF subfamily
VDVTIRRAFPEGASAASQENASPRSRERAQDTPPNVLDLEGVRRRDPEALAAFFEQHFDRVYGLVYRMLGNHHAAEDATQDVFLKLHRAAHTLDPSRDPGPWVTTIAFNVCRDLWRSSAAKLSRRSTAIDDPSHGDGSLPTSADDPERDLVRSERERLVQAAIGSLKEPLRAVIVLREYQGLSYEQIADMEKISPIAARKRYSRALAELGKKLGSVLT